MNSTPLEGQVALVTGAGRNIGRAIALALADAGAKVVVNVRTSRIEAQAVVDETTAQGGQTCAPRQNPAPARAACGQPDEIASAVVWLASPGARFTTGQTLHINGGAYLGG